MRVVIKYFLCLGRDAEHGTKNDFSTNYWATEIIEGCILIRWAVGQCHVVGRLGKWVDCCWELSRIQEFRNQVLYSISRIAQCCIGTMLVIGVVV